MDFFEFEAITDPGHFIRHRNFLGELTRKEGPFEDFQFRLVSRGEQGHVALRSKNFKDLSLRHRDFRVRLEGPAGPNDQLFLQDSTFVLVRGLADPNGISFRAFNFPDRFLRHRDFRLFVEAPDTPNFERDATFLKRRAPVIIDEGTVLVPASD